jgi:hypothetical protein
MSDGRDLKPKVSSGAVVANGGVAEASGAANGAASGSADASANGTDAGVDATDTEGEPPFESSTVDASPEVAAPLDASAEEGCSGVFCDDFERGQIDPGRWDTQTTGGETMTVEQQNVAHGHYAAQFHGLGRPTGASGYAYLITKSAPTSLYEHNFGRAYFYVQVKVTSVDLGLVFGGTAGFPKPTYMSVAGHSGGWQLGFIKLDGSPTGESQAYPQGPMPVARWLCLEWEFNDQPDEINVWADGTAIGSLNSNDVAYPPNHPAGSVFNNMSSGLIGVFTDFGIGFYDWHPSGVDFDVYFDDFVLDTKRIGCLAP